MPAVPAVRGTSKQILYPFKRKVEFVTRVAQAANGAEQRFVVRPPLQRFELPYSDIVLSDATAQGAFFVTAKGRFDRTITLTLGATTYSHLTLESDTFDAITKEPLLYGTSLKLRQTQNGAWSPPAPPSDYPTFANGASTQYTYNSGLRFITWVNDLETGPRYARSSYGGSLSNFPSTALPYWKIHYGLLDETDLQTLEDFFKSCQGRYQSFTFTDPLTGTPYPNFRLDQDVLEISYREAHGVGGHLVSTDVSVVQFFVP